MSENDIGQRILDNAELVQRILDSGKDLSPPMTVEEFKAWLARLAADAS